MSVLSLTEVTHRYGDGPAEVTALDHIDLVVDADELVAVVGPSGSGKSTLLAVAGALLTPSSGHVHIGGTDLTRTSPKQRTEVRRNLVGFVFQSVNLVPFLTALENLVVVAELAGHRADARTRARVLLDRLGIADRADRLPSELSGGERQRVATGRALMNRPLLLLVDELTAALDSHRGAQVMDLLRTEVKHEQTAAIVVTHDLRVASAADRVLELVDGTLSSAGPVGRPVDHAARQT